MYDNSVYYIIMQYELGINYNYAALHHVINYT